MIWYVAYACSEGWEIYKVTNNGQTYTRYKVIKTQKALDNFSRTHWLRKRA